MRIALLGASVLAAALSAVNTLAADQTAQRQSAIEASAKVESVNQETREVRLRTANGRELMVVAGPEVRSLPQLQSGDVVRVTYYESVAASLAKPDVACTNKKQAYLDSLSQQVMPSAQRHDYENQITGGFQRCMAGEDNPWHGIDKKLTITQEQTSAQPPAGETATKTVATAAPVSNGGTPPGWVGGTTVDMVVEFVSYDSATGVATYKRPDGATNSIVVNPAMRQFAAARKPGDKVAVEITRAMAISIVKGS